MGNAQADPGWLAGRLRSTVPWSAAVVHLSDPRTGTRPSSGDEHRPGRVSNGDYLHVARHPKRRDAYDASQSRRARRVRHSRSSVDVEPGAPGDCPKSRTAEVDPRATATGREPRFVAVL